MPMGTNAQGLFPVDPMEERRRAAIAAEAGFPSYEAMLLYAGQRGRKRDSQTVGQRNTLTNERQVPVNSGQIPQQQQGVGMGLTSIFDRIGQALRGSR